MPTRGAYQGTPAWYAERRTGYGASDAPILVQGDEAAWRQLHGEKLGLLPERVGTETMDLGKELEDPIAKLAAKRLGERLYRVNRIVRHPDLPHVFASLDRRRRLTSQRAWRPVEIKKWGHKTDEFGPAGSDIVPVRWLYQVQQQAAVTGADAVDIWVLFGGSKLEPFTVGRDEGMIDEILRLESAAWKHVERGEMPPWPGEAPIRIVLAADEVPIDDTLINLVELHEQADQRAKEAAQHLKDAKDRLRGALAAAGAARGVLPDGRRVSIAHRPQADSETTDWRLVAQALRKKLALAADYTDAELDALEAAFTSTTAGARPLRVTIGKGQNNAAA